MNKIVEKFNRFIYYSRRAGIGYPVRRIFGKRDFPMKYYKYYESLPQKEYGKELSKQIRLFVRGGVSYNIDQPRTFNEKIQWLKVHDCTPLKTKLADKYAVREWIAEKIGDEYLVPLVGGPWKSGNEIDFDKLPNQFALKANHGSAMNLIVKDKSKLNYDEAIRTANMWMNTLFGYAGMETHYFDIPRRIIAEKYIEQSDGNLLDYKIYCFNGKPTYFQVIGDRNPATHDGRVAFYDLDWNLQGFNTGNYLEYEYELMRPKDLEKLIAIAEILSKDFKYVRVDMYEVDGRIYFGEMTFTPGNGFLPWNPEEANLNMGNLLKLE